MWMLPKVICPPLLPVPMSPCSQAHLFIVNSTKILVRFFEEFCHPSGSAHFFTKKTNPQFYQYFYFHEILWLICFEYLFHVLKTEKNNKIVLFFNWEPLGQTIGEIEGLFFREHSSAKVWLEKLKKKKNEFK